MTSSLPTSTRARTDLVVRMAVSNRQRAIGRNPDVGVRLCSVGKRPVRARIGIFDDVVEAVAGQDISVIARAMDVAGQRVRYNRPDLPHTVVLQHLLERVDEYATGLGEYALVIADEVDAQARHRADLASYREIGTSGYRSRKLTRIVDTLHFAPSNASRLVQAADVIAFLYRRAFA